jgi:hypothetical protein
MDFLVRQIKSFFINRIGLALVFFNLFLIVLGIYEKGSTFIYFHFYYEPLPIKLFVILNWWIFVLVDELERELFPPEVSHWSYVKMSDFFMLNVVILCILTWLIIGYIFHLFFQNIHRK